MVEIEYMHACDYAFLADGGKPCVIGIFDVINASSFPSTHPYMAVAIQFRGQQHARVPVQVELSKPNGDILAQVNGEIGIGPDGGAFLSLNMVNIVFPDAGRYTVKVSSSGQVLATRSIRAQRMTAMAPTPAQITH